MNNLKPYKINSEKQLIQKIKNLEFYDNSLSIKQKEVDKLRMDKSRQQEIKSLKCYKESNLVSKLFCIHKYLHEAQDDYSNPSTVITKKEYKTICLNKDNANVYGAIQHNVSGMYFESETEWDLYLNVYKKLTKYAV